jgi:hypothetical protein
MHLMERCRLFDKVQGSGVAFTASRRGSLQPRWQCVLIRALVPTHRRIDRRRFEIDRCPPLGVSLLVLYSLSTYFFGNLNFAHHICIYYPLHRD